MQRHSAHGSAQTGAQPWLNRHTAIAGQQRCRERRAPTTLARPSACRLATPLAWYSCHSASEAKSRRDIPPCARARQPLNAPFTPSQHVQAASARQGSPA